MTRISIAPMQPALTVPQLQAAVVGVLRDLQGQLNAQTWQPTENIEMSGFRISNLGDPAANRDAINKAYLDKRLENFTLSAGALGSSSSTTTVITTLGIQIAY